MSSLHQQIQRANNNNNSGGGGSTAGK